MSIILELRDKRSHTGVLLVHSDSEHVVLGNVFGVLKNISPQVALNAWLGGTTMGAVPPAPRWRFKFWQKQPHPQGVIEGSTEVDLVLECAPTLVFVEVKLGAGPSTGTRSDPERNQLVRNLDVGYARAIRAKKQFALMYVTPEQTRPEIVGRIKDQPPAFPGSPNVDPFQISMCLHWSSWAAIGDELAQTYKTDALDGTAQNFTLDVLAYLAKKRLWQNTLPDQEQFYDDELYRSLRRDGSPFVAYTQRARESYQDWRFKAWTEERLRAFMSGLRVEDKALLKILADADGGLQQHTIMERLPFLRGRTSASLRAYKKHVNDGCRALDCAPLLAGGLGSRDFRIHEINPSLGALRAVVIELAKGFEIPWHLLERRSWGKEQKTEHSTAATRISLPGKTKAWCVIKGDADRLIAAFVDAKGSCSCRLYAYDTGHFIRRSGGRGSFRTLFAALLRDAAEFSPPYQPDLVSTETQGLPADILAAAKSAREQTSPEVTAVVS